MALAQPPRMPVAEILAESLAILPISDWTATLEAGGPFYDQLNELAERFHGVRIGGTLGPAIDALVSQAARTDVPDLLHRLQSAARLLPDGPDDLVRRFAWKCWRA